ncbi:MAG TPA: hypothetical protein VNJ70_14620 [Thermoanaerobaculia bacterium]|nr:hypothetical protein [Thermoanaerobaculia bacterium]
MIVLHLIAAPVAVAEPAPAAQPAVAPAPSAEKKMACCDKMAKGDGCACCKDMDKKHHGDHGTNQGAEGSGAHAH